LTERLTRMGVKVLFHRTSISEAINAAKPDDIAWRHIAHGAFLRVDIPMIDTESEFILYTDCDVIFLRNPNIQNIKPKLFSVAPEFDLRDFKNMNSGVMVMNVNNMRNVFKEFTDFIRNGLPNFPAYDQGALREFFAGKYDPLPLSLNWKPYWGANPDAEIIHFHGPKPRHARDMLRGDFTKYPKVLRDLFLANRANYALLDEYWHACLDKVRSFHSE